jgi:CRP-like cAMP-binding protein
MENPLVLKLGRFLDLSHDERRAIENLSVATAECAAGDDILVEGRKAETVALILSGLACRYKCNENGTRRIVGIMVPGDLCDLYAFILKSLDHSISAISKVTFAAIPKERLLALFDDHPRVMRAFWWSTLVDEGTLREWILNSKQPVINRIAHILSEICVRLETVGLAGDHCEIAMRQELLADAVGASRSHVSEALSSLKDQGLVGLNRGSIAVKRVGELQKVGNFNAEYLHLEKSLVR